MAYSRINWQNSPSHATPLSAENLNIMDQGIKDLDDAVTEASGDISTLEDAVDTNAENITTLQSTVSGHTTSIGNLQTAVNTNTGNIGNLQTTVGNHTTSITNLGTSVEANTEDIADLKEDYDDLSTALTDAVTTLDGDKADKTGTYMDMTVGNADQLISTHYVEDSFPYLFRTTGGSADVGNREYVDAIVGGTVAWNQMVITRTYNDTTAGITAVSNNDGKYAISGEATSSAVNLWFWGSYDKETPLFTLKANHKYYLKDANIYVVSSGVNGSVVVSLDNGETMFTKSEDTGICGVRCPNATVDQTYDLTIYPQLFDLTQLFGTTIADHIYSLEQANAGDGVAFFRKLFPKPYYPYNAGELISVSGLDSHDMVGFNQWDEEWEVGGINDNTGAESVSTERIRAKNHIPVVPNTTYYVQFGEPNYSWNLIAYQYDANKNYLGNTSATRTAITSANKTLTTTADCHYIRFQVHPDYGTTYKNDICINLSWSGTHNGEYQPYEKNSYPLDSSLTLRGIPKISNGNLYYDGDRYEPDGTVERRYGVVDLGTLSWGFSTTGDGIKVYWSNSLINTIKPVVSHNDVPNFVSVKYPSFAWNGRLSVTKGISELTSGQIYIIDSDYQSESQMSDFVASLSGVILVYELATPTTETADPYQQTQLCNDWGTEEFVSTGIVPVGHETRYPANLRDKLQHLPDLADADGYYMISQSGSQMTLEHFRIPKAPTESGTYVLKATVSGGTPTYTWESDS